MNYFLKNELGFFGLFFVCLFIWFLRYLFNFLVTEGNCKVCSKTSLLSQHRKLAFCNMLLYLISIYECFENSLVPSKD